MPDSFGVAIIENYIIILSLDMCLGILLVRIPHHVLNEKSTGNYDTVSNQNRVMLLFVVSVDFHTE